MLHLEFRRRVRKSLAQLCGTANSGAVVLKTEVVEMLDKMTKQKLKTGGLCVAQSLCLQRLARELQILVTSGEANRFDNRLIVEELLKVLHRGLWLISCSGAKEDWVIRALICEENREEFREVCEEFLEIMELLQPGIMLGRDIKLDELQSAATYDRNWLEMTVSASLEENNHVWRPYKRHHGRKMDFLQRLLREGPLSVDYRQLRFKGHIADGAYGRVQKVNWLGCTFAVKLLEHLDRSFEREVQAFAILKHPNVLRMLAFCTIPKAAIIMEKMDMDLEKFIEQQQRKQDFPFPIHVAVSILLQIAKGMKYLHEKNVIHRDLKPKNILVKKFGTNCFILKIADFGVARTDYITGKLTHSTTRAGTLRYMAPEVYMAESSSIYSKKADVYSFGMVCYHILAGKPPFGEKFRFLDSLRTVLELPPACPDLLKNLVQDCWSKDSSQRPSFADILMSLKLIKSHLLSMVLL